MPLLTLKKPFKQPVGLVRQPADDWQEVAGEYIRLLGEIQHAPPSPSEALAKEGFAIFRGYCLAKVSLQMHGVYSLQGWIHYFL